MNIDELSNVLKESLEDGFHRYRTIANKYNRLNEKKKNNGFSMADMPEVINELKGYLKGMNDIQTEINKKINELSIQAKKDLEESENLNPKEITEDSKLLTLGIALTQKDIESMLDRNQGNRTMTQLIFRYAREHDIKVNRVYESALDDSNAIDNLCDGSRVAVKWFENPETYMKVRDTLFQEESEESGE